jgi:alpha-galactosidase
LNVTHRLAERYAGELGMDLRFSSTQNLSQAVQEAGFVINTAYVKGHRHEWTMREVAAKHDYRYDGVQLGDFYQLRFALDLAREMERLCPTAWLLQIANPVFNCSTLVSRQTAIKTCGLCHGHLGHRRIASTVGLDPDRISWQAPGLNHNIWLTRFQHDGQDAYPLIDRWIEEQAEGYWKNHRMSSTHDIEMSRGAVHQYQMYGLFPVGDTVRRLGGGATVGCTVHRGEWWLHTNLDTEKYWFGEPFGGPDNEVARPYFEQILNRRTMEIAELAADSHASVLKALGAEASEEQAIPLINSIVNDAEGEYQVNVPNGGAIRKLPDDVVVEVSARVGKKGIQPHQVGDLPPKIMIECLLPHWLDMERNLLAFNTGDRSILLWNALDSHQTRSYEQGRAVMEELLTMTGHEEMNKHFRYPRNWHEELDPHSLETE